MQMQTGGRLSLQLSINKNNCLNTRGCSYVGSSEIFAKMQTNTRCKNLMRSQES